MQKIAPHIYCLQPPGKPVYPYSNALWIDDDRSLLIDLGAGIQAYRELPRPVDTVLVTHAHFDHLHCNVLFPDSELWGAQEEIGVYNDENAYLQFHGYAQFWPRLMQGIERPPLGEVRPMSDNVPVKPGFRYIELNGEIVDGQVFDTGRYQVRAVHLPGHTSGHYGFLIEPIGLLASGDIDFYSGGPGYYNATGDVGALLSSIDKLEKLSPEQVLPAHRHLQQGGLKEKLETYARPVRQRIERLYQYLSQPRRLEQLYDIPLFFHEPNSIYEIFWNRMTMLHHLEHLSAENLVEEIEAGVLLRR